jgi:hypothetical protein
MMKKIKYLVLGKRKEKGAILILTLIMLAIVVALVPATVMLINSGAKTGTMYSQRNDELYAADAGVQDALPVIMEQVSLDPDWSGVGSTTVGTINNKSVSYQVSYVSPADSGYVDKYGIAHGVYRIISHAGETPGNPSTTITADTLLLDSFYNTFGKNAITVANGDVLSSSGGVAAEGYAVMGVGDITITNPGTHYDSSPISNFSISGGSGSGATATALTSGGEVISVIVDLGHIGSGYTAPFNFTIPGGDGNATAMATLAVADVAITYGGQGYDNPPEVSFYSLSGSGADAGATIASHRVNDVTVGPGDGGHGYTTAPTVTFIGGLGFPASATTVQGNVQLLGSGNVDIFYATAVDLAAVLPRRSDSLTITSGPGLYTDWDEIENNIYDNHGELIYYDAGSLILENSAGQQETIDYNDITIFDNSTLVFSLSQQNQRAYIAGDDVYVSKPQDATPPETWPPSPDPVQRYYLNEVANADDWTVGTTFNVSDAANGGLHVDNGNPNTNYTITGSGTLGGVIYVNGNLNFNNGTNIALGTNALTTLTSISNTTLSVISTSGFPTTGALLVGEGASEEMLKYSSRSTNTFTLVDPPTKAHSVGDPVSSIGQTIFVTGEITMDTHVTLSGPGSIISIGDMDFQPNLGNDDYILVLSLDGTIHFQPQNLTVFHGSVAAAYGVEFLTNVTIICEGAEGFGLNIPGIEGAEPGGIVTWIID